MVDSIQHKIGRVRPPRVQITYDVHTGGASEKVELPLIVGVMANLSGDQAIVPEKLKERKFVEIDRDNFMQYLTKTKPRLEFIVRNDPENDPKFDEFTSAKVSLTFEHMDDFRPENLLTKAENDFGNAKVRELSRSRGQLTDFMAKLDGNDDLNDKLLEEIFELSYKATSSAVTKVKNEGAPQELVDALQKLQEKTAKADLGKNKDDFLKDLQAELPDDSKPLLDPATPKNFCDSVLKNTRFFPPSYELDAAAVTSLEKEAVPRPILDKLNRVLTARSAPSDDAEAPADGAAAPSFLFEGEDAFWNALMAEVGEEKLGEMKLELFQDQILKHCEKTPSVQISADGLKSLLDQAAGEGWDAAPNPDDLIEKIIDVGKLARLKSQRKGAYQMLLELGQQLSAQGDEDAKMLPGPDMMKLLTLRVATIDRQISVVINHILHHEKFQKLEASWLGLQKLVMETETGTMLKIRLMNIRLEEIEYDLDTAVEFDQSVLFKKIYEEEYGTLGGFPYSLLIGDYSFGRSARDVLTLTKISEVASAAHAPFIAAADSSMLDMDSFQGLGIPRDLKKMFESSELISWNAYRGTEESRYVTLTLPRILKRLPYHSVTNPVKGFVFDEDVDGTDHSKYLWGSPAYALGLRITNAFALYRWCAAIRGVEGGGKVENLPVHLFRTPYGDQVMKCPTEVEITDRREKELSDLGFVSLVHRKGNPYSVFIGGQTTNRPKEYVDNQANANSRISAVLPYMLAASRFAHYLKVIVRDKVGSFQTADEIAKFLNNWISQYVLLKDDADQELKAEYPLREARIDVSEVPGKPGVFTAIAFLRPHFQLEELTASIRLVADLPAPAGA